MINSCFQDAYRAAANGLRTTREQAGLTAETVEEAIEAFRHEAFIILIAIYFHESFCFL